MSECREEKGDGRARSRSAGAAPEKASWATQAQAAATRLPRYTKASPLLLLKVWAVHVGGGYGGSCCCGDADLLSGNSYPCGKI